MWTFKGNKMESDGLEKLKQRPQKTKTLLNTLQVSQSLYNIYIQKDMSTLILNQAILFLAQTQEL